MQDNPRLRLANLNWQLIVGQKVRAADLVAQAVDPKLAIFWPLKYVKEQVRCVRIFFLRRPTPLEPHKWAGRRAINR